MILVIIFLNTMIYENFILNEFNMLFGTVWKDWWVINCG
jgi:hypothetical protein